MMKINETELWDVYDINGHFMNKTIQKGSALCPGEYNLYVDIWVMNEQGRLLLTLRAPDKETAPSKWENTGGAVLSGEKPAAGAVRELFEETGIAVREEDLVEIGVLKSGSRISYIYLYLCKSDDTWIRLSPRETVDYKWEELDIIKRMIDNNMFVPEIKAKFQLAAGKLEEYSKRERGSRE